VADKVIVTNWTALKKKYGAKTANVDSAIKKMIAADKARGLITILLRVDATADMKKVGGGVVTSAKSEKQNKKAIDKIDAKLSPDYILILGSVDVIPHQSLTNPVFDPGSDDDKFAFSDLPYACDVPYSKDPADFIGPTRVVGRLPGITGDTDPRYLISLIENAMAWEASPPKTYANGFGISALVWKGSTAMSMKNLFGSGSAARLSPEEGPEWTSPLLSRRSHFINCHGALAEPFFYGQKGNSFPVAHEALFVSGKISRGTVAAMECCYGAELYEPDDAHAGIANTYLQYGAYGYFGSTTIAYGPANDNGAADLICQYFLKSVLGGASLGRAALEARQKFAQHAPELDPVDLKTIAQFIFLGDPSIHPVKTTAAPASKTRGMAAAAEGSVSRDDRRRGLLVKGVMISQSQPVARRSTAALSPAVRSSLMKLAAKNLEQPLVMSFDVDRRNPQVRSAFMKGRMAAKSPSSFHVLIGRGKRTGIAPKTRGGTPGQPPIKPLIALVAKEAGGKIVSVRQLFGKRAFLP